MPKVAIVYFSGYGHTARQAEAVRIGAQSTPDVLVSVYRINETGDLPSGALEELSSADAFIYGSPTYMGGPAWQFKKFAYSSAKAFFARKWKDKIAAGFTNSALDQWGQVRNDPIFLDVIAAARASLDRQRLSVRQYEDARSR